MSYCHAKSGSVEGISVMRSFLDNIKAQLPLADFIHRNHTLPATFEPVNFRIALLQMLLTDTAVHALSPQVKTASLQRFSHQCNHIRFPISKLQVNRFKRGSVFPGHFNDAIDVDEIFHDCWM